MKKVVPQYFIQFPWVAKLYPQKVTFSDDDYNFAKSDWITQKLYPFFRQELERLGVVEWDRKFDCEDFAHTFRICAQACHRQSRGTAEGIAVGEIDYAKDSGEYHCINAIFTEKGLLFFEPQSGKFIILSSNEQNSINRFRI